MGTRRVRARGDRPGGAARSALLVCLLIGSSSCTHHEPLPSGPELVKRASTAMRAVATVRFSLVVDGETADLGIRRGEGVLSRSGEASGTIQLDQGGGVIEYEVVIDGGTYYLKGPTGGFQAVPSFLASQLYDPTTFLDPDVGFAAVLARATGARTVAAESVDGTAGYRVEARIPTDLLQGVVPLSPGQKEVAASLWIGRSDPVLLRVKVVSRPAGATGSSTMTLTLTDPNLTVHITPPAP